MCCLSLVITTRLDGYICDALVDMSPGMFERVLCVIGRHYRFAVSLAQWNCRCVVLFFYIGIIVVIGSIVRRRIRVLCVCMMSSITHSLIDVLNGEVEVRQRQL